MDPTSVAVAVAVAVLLAAAVYSRRTPIGREPASNNWHSAEYPHHVLMSGRHISATTVRFQCAYCPHYEDVYDPPPHG